VPDELDREGSGAVAVESPLKDRLTRRGRGPARIAARIDAGLGAFERNAVVEKDLLGVGARIDQNGPVDGAVVDGILDEREVVRARSADDMGVEQGAKLKRF